MKGLSRTNACELWYGIHAPTVPWFDELFNVSYSRDNKQNFWLSRVNSKNFLITQHHRLSKEYAIEGFYFHR